MDEQANIRRSLVVQLENLHLCYTIVQRHSTTLQDTLSNIRSESTSSAMESVLEEVKSLDTSLQSLLYTAGEFMRLGDQLESSLGGKNEMRKHYEEFLNLLQQGNLSMEMLLNEERKYVEQMGSQITLNSASSASEFMATPKPGRTIQESDTLQVHEAAANVFSNAVPTQLGWSMSAEKAKSSVLLVPLKNEEEVTEPKQSSSMVSIAPSSTDHETSTPVIITGIMRTSIVADPAMQISMIPKKRRSRIPNKPNRSLKLWSILKNCAGKDLSRIPMPVNFNEPISMLQRLTEDFEHSSLLDVAANLKDPADQLAYVAAFAVSCYSNTACRLGKPFNPVLGETYECDRTDDFGWRCIAEQISHHPPTAAIHCEGRQWVAWQELTIVSKFKAKYLQVDPKGSAFVQFKNSGNKYVWQKVTTVVNNILIGKLWVDQRGDMEIKGLANSEGYTCRISFVPYSFFHKEEQRKINGKVMNAHKEVKWVLRGTWDQQIEIAKLTANVCYESDVCDMALHKSCNFSTIWQRNPEPAGSELYYHFSHFACQLNEMEENVAPTDSRMRPDQRLMENGDWDESNKEKLRIEEKQRRRIREAAVGSTTSTKNSTATTITNSEYQPLWFLKAKDNDCETIMHVYGGRYWYQKERKDWTKCPDLF